MYLQVVLTGAGILVAAIRSSPPPPLTGPSPPPPEICTIHFTHLACCKIQEYLNHCHSNKNTTWHLKLVQIQPTENSLPNPNDMLSVINSTFAPCFDFRVELVVSWTKAQFVFSAGCGTSPQELLNIQLTTNSTPPIEFCTLPHVNGYYPLLDCSPWGSQISFSFKPGGGDGFMVVTTKVAQMLLVEEELVDTSSKALQLPPWLDGQFGTKYFESTGSCDCSSFERYLPWSYNCTKMNTVKILNETESKTGSTNKTRSAALKTTGGINLTMILVVGLAIVAVGIVAHVVKQMLDQDGIESR